MKFSKLSGLLIWGLVGVMLLLGACTSNSTSTTSAPSTTKPVPSSASPAAPVTINLIAQNMAFDQSTLSVPAGVQVTMIFNNKDTAPHNFALYTDSTAGTVIFKGDVIKASTITYQFTAPSTAGTYFFRCDVHAKTMTGNFIVK